MLEACLALSRRRGSEYGDTWDVSQMRGGFLERTIMACPMPSPDSDRFAYWLRLVRAASVVDLKDSRFLNRPWEPDDLDDGINYRAAYRTWRHEYEQYTREASAAPTEGDADRPGASLIDTHTHGEVPPRRPGASLVNPMTEAGLVSLEETLPDGYHLHSDGPLAVICNAEHGGRDSRI